MRPCPSQAPPGPQWRHPLCFQQGPAVLMEVLNNPFAAKKFMSRRDVCGCEQTLERGSRPQRLVDNNHEVPSLSFRPLGCQFPMTQQMSPPSARARDQESPGAPAPGAGLWAQRERERERSVMFLCSRRSQLDGGGRPPSHTPHPADKEPE